METSFFRVDGIDRPASRNTFQLEIGAFVEHKAARLLEKALAHRCRHENLVRRSGVDDPSADVDVEARALVTGDPARARVDADAETQLERPDEVTEGTGERKRARGIVEDGEQTVTGRVHLLAPGRGELTAEQLLKTLHEDGPPPVPDLRQELSGADDIDEEHRRRVPIAGAP